MVVSIHKSWSSMRTGWKLGGTIQFGFRKLHFYHPISDMWCPSYKPPFMVDFSDEKPRSGVPIFATPCGCSPSFFFSLPRGHGAFPDGRRPVSWDESVGPTVELRSLVGGWKMLKMAVPLMGTLHQKWHKQMGKMMVHLWIEGYFLLTQISFWMIGMATHKPRMDDWYFVLTQISFDFPSRLNRYGGFLSQTQPRIASAPEKPWIQTSISVPWRLCGLKKPACHLANIGRIPGIRVRWLFSLGYSAYCLAIRYHPNGSTNWTHRYFLMAAVVKGMRELSKSWAFRDFSMNVVWNPGTQCRVFGWGGWTNSIRQFSIAMFDYWRGIG